MKNAVGDAAESIGFLLTPAVIAVSNALKFTAEAVSKIASAISDDLPQAVLDASAAFEEQTKALKGTQSNYDLAKKSMESLREQFVEGTEGTKAFESILKSLALTTGDSDKQARILEVAIKNGILLRREQQVATQEYADAESFLIDFTKTEIDTLEGLDNAYLNFTETQKVKLANQVAEAGMVARLIQDNRELAKALGLVNDKKKKSKSLTDDNISAIKSWAFALNSAAQINRDKSHANALFAKRAAQLEAIVNTASAITEALPNIPKSIAMGVLGAIQIAKIESAKFAKGGDFVTSGPQNILVGDNPGGRERVQVTPLSSPNTNGPQGGVTVNIQGDFLGSEGQADKLANIIEQRSRLGHNRIAVNA
jgi:hypothetical protein